ncbi:MAG: hypothetical protein ABJO02_16440 [Reichenbachiella sp.]|uniref:hypothetical protein n=1 Tax=Reichenbachiella sp. TaxID=2184521 RepID=UPI0032972503
MNKYIKDDRDLMRAMSYQDGPSARQITNFLDSIVKTAKTDSKSVIESDLLDLYIKWKTLLFHTHGKVYKEDILEIIEQNKKATKKNQSKELNCYREILLNEKARHFNGHEIITIENAASFKELYLFIKDKVAQHIKDQDIELGRENLTVLSELSIEFNKITPYFKKYEKWITSEFGADTIGQTQKSGKSTIFDYWFFGKSKKPQLDPT